METTSDSHPSDEECGDKSEVKQLRCSVHSSPWKLDLLPEHFKGHLVIVASPILLTKII